jgi:ABC-2 type transport system permease protein
VRKTLVIAIREYRAAVTTKAFIISMLALPILWGGAAAVQVALKDKVDTKDKRIALLDYTGQIAPAVREAVQIRNNTDIFSGEGAAKKQMAPRYLIEEGEPADQDVDKATFELSERVRKEELLAFVVIGAEAVDPKAEGPAGEVRYHSNSPTYDDVQNWIEGPINDRIQQLRFAAANLDPLIVNSATRKRHVQNLGLVSMDEHGNLIKAVETNEDVSMAVAMGLMMLMLMVVMVGASPLLQSVLEEKTNRIAEVLLGSVSPFELMMGKLIGMVGVSLTIGTVYLAAGFLGIQRAGYGAFLPPHVVGWFLMFQCLAVLMYGAIFIAIGAAVSDLKEAQSLMLPVTVLIMVPLFVWVNVVKEPTSTFALATSLFPPATPMLMTLRQAVPPGIPAWQPLLGMLLVLLCTVAFVFAAGRVFRVGLLLQGKAPKMTELARWVLRG